MSTGRCHASTARVRARPLAADDHAAIVEPPRDRDRERPKNPRAPGPDDAIVLAHRRLGETPVKVSPASHYCARRIVHDEASRAA